LIIDDNEALQWVCVLVLRLGTYRGWL